MSVIISHNSCLSCYSGAAQGLQSVDRHSRTVAFRIRMCVRMCVCLASSVHSCFSFFAGAAQGLQSVDRYSRTVAFAHPHVHSYVCTCCRLCTAALAANDRTSLPEVTIRMQRPITAALLPQSPATILNPARPNSCVRSAPCADNWQPPRHLA